MRKKKRNKTGVNFSIKLVVALLLVAFLSFAIMDRQSSHLQKVSIKINTRDDNKYLIGKKEVRKILANELGFDLSIAKLSQIDLHRLEERLEADDRVNRAEIYIDKHNRMTIGIIQNLPIVRVHVNGGEDYYLDADGSKVSKTEELRVPVVTGAVDKYRPDFKKRKDSNLNYVLTLSRMLHEDEFLSGLVGQVEINENDEIVLIPIMGRKKINLGSQEGLANKINKLKIYYEKGIKNIGIDRFDLLDLQYDGQIVGSNTES